MAKTRNKNVTNVSATKSLINAVQKVGTKVRAAGSSNIESFKYDEALRTLTITFRKKRTYEYFDVPKNIYIGLVQAPSRGQYFHQKIAKRFNYAEID